MAKLSGQEAYAKWGNRLVNAVPDVKQGVSRVTESPMVKAAAKEDKWFSGLQKAKSTGKWKRSVLSVPLEEWKMKTGEIGADRIAAGVAAAEGKSTQFYNKLLPFIDKLQAKVKGMPDATIQDSLARMNTFVLGMAEFDRTK